jgi:hypothetical protein
MTDYEQFAHEPYASDAIGCETVAVQPGGGLNSFDSQIVARSAVCERTQLQLV